MPDAKASPTIQQIQAAWETAQRTLAELREQVERTSELAKAKVQANFLERDLDKALYELGKSVWEQVQKGKLQLPSSLAGAMRAAQEAQRKIDQQNAEITDLLREGAEVKAKRGPVSGRTAVASKGKKR